jgi:hypothetical protein
MRYTTDSPSPDWSRYKFYSHLQAIEDMAKGGWILHFLAGIGGHDEYDDYERCQKMDVRYSRIIGLTQPLAFKSYIPKYQNWYHLNFPLLHVVVNDHDKFDPQMEYDDLPNEIRQVCNMAEKHLLVDYIFIKFVYDKTRRFANEWDVFTSKEKDKLLMQFKDSKWADEENLRQQLPQAEFDPYYKPKQ